MKHTVLNLTLAFAGLSPDSCRVQQQDPGPSSVAARRDASQGLALPEALPAQSKPEAPPEGIWRLSQRCGVNCVYLVLSVLDPRTDYNLVLANTKIGERGSSLLDLKQGMEACGYHAEINTLTPRELPELGLPVIAHLDETSGRSPETGHYVVISDLSIEDGSITIFDGITAQHDVMPLNAFYGRWSGHIIRIPHPAEGLYSWFWVLLLICAVVWTIGRHASRIKAKPCPQL